MTWIANPHTELWDMTCIANTHIYFEQQFQIKWFRWINYCSVSIHGFDVDAMLILQNDA
jgi:hypothetical protein